MDAGLKLKVPNKVKHFIWRACSYALPTKDALWKRSCASTPKCSCCSLEGEFVEHLLLVCNWAQAVRFSCPLSVRINVDNISRFEVWLYDCLSCSSLSDYSKALIGMICWHLWKARCAWVFDNKAPQPIGTMCSAVRDLDEFWQTLGWTTSDISADTVESVNHAR